MTTLTFRKMKEPAFPGELRSRSWKLALVTGKEHMDPLWEKRCRDYWELQERTYGLVMSEFTVACADYAETGPLITTIATVLAIVPGERVEGYVVPR